MAAAAPIPINSLSGGLNDSDPPTELRADECTVANNVEFFWSALGERRSGCDPLDLTSSNLSTRTQIVHLSQWFPTNDPTLPEYWAISATPGVGVTFARRTTGLVWGEITPLVAMSNPSPGIYRVTTQPLNGKKFFTYPSAQNRTFVWDGTSLRPAGLTGPVAPVVTNEGVGSYNTVRYFRIRYIIKNALAQIVSRSEPSSSVQFFPSGTGLGANIARPALLGEGETHWEIEASQDNAFFYRISTQLIATTSYNDETNVANATPAIPAGVVQPAGYVILSNKAQALNITGVISNGSYSDGVSFPLRGWVMYTGAGAYVPVASWGAHNPPLAGDITFATPDVAAALEAAVGFGTSYSSLGPLSEDIGTYLLLPAARFLTYDGDRLILAGHYTDATLQSTVWWTPVANDPGVGNDERLPLSVNNSLPLDPSAGGGITGIASAVSGSWYVFKNAGIYKMTRTGDVTRAYVAITVSTTRGAVEGSIFVGVDANGSPCIFFTDPLMGPSVIGPGGVQTIHGLRRTWNRVNLNATVAARGVYYPYKRQAHWWLALEGSMFPNYKVVSQITEHQQAPDGGVRRGWSTATGRITEAFCASILSELLNINGITALRNRPFVGLSSPDYIQRCDTESIITDAGVAYVATIVTSPFFTAGLLSNWGVMTGALLASANTGTSIKVSLIRNFGLEETAGYTVDLSPVGTEPFVTRQLNSLVLSESVSIQFKFTDP